MAIRMRNIVLRHVKEAHDDIPCVRDDQNNGKRLEHSLEKHKGVDVVHFVLLRHHLGQFIGRYKGEDLPRNGDNNRFRQVADHVEDPGVPVSAPPRRSRQSAPG